jgi:glycosyltransferase involved in cell wall biosynthesis
MKIIFLSFLDPYEIKNWSGTLYHIFRKLNQLHDLIWVGGEIIPQTRVFHYQSFITNIKPLYLEKYALVYGNLISERIKKMDYDLIIARDSFFVAHLKTNKPIVYIGDTTFDLFKHSIKTNDIYNQLAEKVETQMIHNSSKLIYSSEWAKQSAVYHYGISPEKVSVVEFGANIIDFPQANNILPDQFDKCNLLFIGVDEKRKGVRKAYETYQVLKASGFDCSLTIIGCQLQIIETYDPNLQIIPFIDKSKEEGRLQLDKIFRESHFFILPTEFDCYGIVFCEASAYGIPSLANNVGGVKQVVREGKNGFLFSTNATAEDYATIIKIVFEDKGRYFKLRETSRKEFDERLNWDVWLEKTDKIFQDVINEYKKNKNSLQ